MIGSKEAELITAVVLYAMRCLSEGDQHALRTMKFGPREIDALSELNFADLPRVAGLHAHCLTIELDRNVFWPMMSSLNTSRENEEVQRNLIKADAPYEMMRSLFRMGSREYTRLRRMLTNSRGVGRPPEPDDATAHELWQALSPRLRPDTDRPLTPVDYLAVHAECGASLRAIWNHTQRWLEYGDVFARSQDTDGDVVTPQHARQSL